jgi:hypothetical protein
MSIAQGGIFPIFALLLIKALFAMQTTNLNDMYSTASSWILYMFILAIFAFINTFFYKLSFGMVSTNVIRNMRKILYQSILGKHIGWFDDRFNAPGAITNVLSSEIQNLNGVSDEGIAIMLECFGALFTGLFIR